MSAPTEEKNGTGYFPAFIERLTEADIPLETCRAFMVRDRCQALFFELPAGSQSPDHTHGNEWGLVIQGQVDITIDGVTTSYGPGESYFVGEDVVHSVVNHPGLVGITVFEGTDRFTAKA
ncbi:MAG: cupin domain-containing protein [Nocardioidaceae bacterium]|nr:cupin domain-containing protein [Nocardioidaceae bacterium]